MVQRMREQQAVDGGELAPDRGTEAIAALLAKLAAADPQQRSPLIAKLMLEVERSTPAAASLLEAELDRGAFDGLRDADDRAVKATVIGKLVEFGYPSALRVSPEALAYWRESTGFRTERPRYASLLLGLLAFGTGELLISIIVGGKDGVVLPVVHAGIPILLALGRRSDSAWIRAPSRALLLLWGLAGVVIGGATAAFGLLEPLLVGEGGGLQISTALRAVATFGVGLLSVLLARQPPGDPAPEPPPHAEAPDE